MKANATTLAVSAAVIVGALTVLRLSGAAGRLHKSGQDAFAPFSNNIGKTLANVSMWLRGSHAVEFTQGGFYLDSNYIDSWYQITGYWLESIKNTHPDNAKILAALVSPDGRIKEQFRHLIDGPVYLRDVGL